MISRALVISGLVACGTGVLAAGAAAVVPRHVPILRVLSNRADLISGGDALVQILLPRGIVPSRVRVDAGGRDVTTDFALRPDGRFEGLVTGLPVGPVSLTARIRGGRAARLRLVNHPIGGPVIAGPQTQPWVCVTAENGLGRPRDAQCDVPVQYRFAYHSTNPALLGLQNYDPVHPPANVAMTTTDQGRRVPFVVRVETGVMDRGIYTVAVLADPSKTWAPWAPQKAWNQKLDWMFGGDCKPWHRQDLAVDPLGTIYGIPPLDPTVTDLTSLQLGLDQSGGSVLGNGNAIVALGKGFAVANSSLNKLGSSCSSVTSAEAMIMLKEHIAEAYGPIRYTIGSGSSGGSMQQQQIASEYPGLLDGIQPMASFPDIWELAQEAEDCHLLNTYFDSVAPATWALITQQDAVEGALVSLGCRLQLDGPKLGTPDIGSYAATFADPTFAGGCGLPAAQVYDPAKNPKGVRCTLQDYMASVFGRRPDGFANRPFDNVGVEYGLRALQSGQITAAQFVDLNERIGGLDIDWHHTAQRSVADPAALTAAYRGGLVTNGRELAKVPMIDIRGADNFEIHSDFHSYAMRARLDAANGNHDNQVIFEGVQPLVGDPESFRQSFTLMDRWLANVESDTSQRSLAAKVRADRPAKATDSCWIEGRQVSDQSLCHTVFPYYGDPRIAAGGPLADDVLKCRLKPLEQQADGISFDDVQFARLRKVFEDGVCDYSEPGVGQVAPQPWTTFADGPIGRPLGTAPRSHALPLHRGTARRGRVPSDR